MAHFLHQGTEAPREGHCPGWLWVAGGVGCGDSEGKAQQPSSNRPGHRQQPPPALISPTVTMEIARPNPAGLRKPSLIGSSTLGSLFFTGSSQEPASKACLGLGGGVGCSSWSSGLWAAWSGAEGSWEETFEHTGVSRCWEDGKPQLISSRPSPAHPFQAFHASGLT